MKLIKKSSIILVLLVLLIPNSWVTQKLEAQITDCDAVLTPNQVNPGSTNNFSVMVTNGSAERIRWLRFVRPSTNFTLATLTGSGWTVISSDNSQITINGNTINTGVSRTFSLNDVLVANVNAPSANWIVQAADNSAGTDPYNCTGTLGTQIGTPDVTSPVISNIAVSSITSSSAAVSWTTDELSTSRVNYGLTAGYGSNVNDTALTTSHSVNLTGLSPNTGYHFQVVSEDSSNNSASSSDNTFLTSEGATTTSSPDPSNATSGQNPPIQNVVPGDTLAPVVTISTNLKTIYKETPLIVGSAVDDTSLTKIDYSTDGGENWLPVDRVSALGVKSVSFEFQPLGLADGNFDILVRAFDQNNNLGLSSASVLIIDQLPPLIGPNSVSFGSQFAQVDNDVISAVIGVDQRLTLSTLGGPTSLSLKASSDSNESKIFTLTKANSSQLWSGVLAFEKAGDYSLIATAKDGAGNIVTRELNKVHVIASSQVIEDHGPLTFIKPVAQASVTVFTLDPEQGKWEIWEGESFGQKNPQQTDNLGRFNFFLPTGKYYLSIEADLYHSKNSEIFTLNEASPLSTTASLRKKTKVGFGDFSWNLPRFSLKDFGVQTAQKLEVQLSNLSSNQFPEMAFVSTDGSTLNSRAFEGRKSLLVVLNIWSASAEEQISQLEKLVEEKDYNISILVPLESSNKVAAYKKIGRYNLNFLTDPQGQLVTKLNSLTLPQHIFLNEKLEVVEVKTGVFLEGELQEILNTL